MIVLGKKIVNYMAEGLLAFSAFIGYGCSQRPNEVLKEKEMVDLMADLQLVEAYSSIVPAGSGRAQREELARGVLAQHGVSQPELDTTLAWYGRNLDEYEKLFEKVDRRLLEKRKSIVKADGNEDIIQGDILWPYGRHGIVSPLGITDGWIFSIENPEIEKGDRLEWNMYMANPSVSLNGVLGVEYDDGTAEAITSIINSRQKVLLNLQTDTGKVVNRIYGTLRSRSELNEPIFADSISLYRLPFDSLEYNKFRSQKKYGIPSRNKPKKSVEKSDTSSSNMTKAANGESRILDASRSTR